MKRSLMMPTLLAGFCFISMAATASPPPGHPKIYETDKAPHGASSVLPNKGRVLDVIQAGSYTYLEVKGDEGVKWIAVTQTDVPKDSLIEYSEGNLMKDFHSKVLNRTFPEILFAGSINVVQAGHPTIKQAAQILQIPEGAELPNEGRVLTVIPSNAYSYIEVENKGKSHWLAAPNLEIEKGTLIRYGEGAPMKDFYSKKLDRVFSEVLFVNGVQVVKK